MQPTMFGGFFTASAGAGATLVGLLFVAVSVAPEPIFGKGARFEHQLIASSAFTALINAFFISLGAIIPSNSYSGTGTVVLVMGAIALVNSVALGVNLIRRTTLETTLQSALMVVASLIVYGWEVQSAVLLLRTPSDPSPVYTICGLLVGVYGFGIVRAWQLLGADRRGFVNFIVPLLRRAQHNLAQNADGAPETDGAAARATAANSRDAIQSSDTK